MANFDLYPVQSSDFHTVESDCTTLAEFVEEVSRKQFFVGRFVTWAGRKLPQSVEYGIAVATIHRIVKGR